MTEPTIRQPVALRTLHGIEMAAVGTWNASTGTTTFTVEDFADAVAALDCPGVRNPVIKLGHSEEDSTSGIRWDGEPALGWVANMRFDGAKLIGDFTGMPGWLVDADENGLSVMAAAYPDRSIEIWRPFVCQIGHMHPSVVTAISLLGVAPPGVGVLKSMQDVYAAFTTDPGAAAIRASAAMTLRTTITLAAAGDRREPTPVEQQSGVDFEAEREQWQSELGDLLDTWPDISGAQRDELAAQVAEAVDGNPDALGDLKVDSAAAAAALLVAMRALAEKAATAQVAAAAKQGVTLDLPEITEDIVRPVADAVAASMASSASSMAARTAAQQLGIGSGQDVADHVRQAFDALTDTFLRDQLGGALSAAQHRGRIAVLEGWDGAVDFYASEINDADACANCRSIDGTKFDSLDQADALYGGGKYVDCLGGARCRGQLIAIFGSGAARASAPLLTTIRTNLGGEMPTVVKASVSVEDISRKYYESAGYSMWITEMQVDPLQLIAADDATGKYYRIPVELSGESFTFGEPQEVAIAYQDVKQAAKAGARFDSRKVSLLAAGKKEDGSDLVAPDVSPAGAAIRKAAQKLEAPTAVIETEVLTPEPEPTKTPDADPATGPTTTPKEASVDEAKMREALGLGPDATKEEIAQAFAAQVSATAPPAQPDQDPLAVLTAKLPAGEKPILVDPENYKALLSMAVKGEQAYARTVKTEGREFLAAAAREGRFPVSRLSTYEEMWDKNPEETRAYISLMPKNTVPTLAAGILGHEISENESEMAYNAYMGEALNHG